MVLRVVGAREIVAPERLSLQRGTAVLYILAGCPGGFGKMPGSFGKMPGGYAVIDVIVVNQANPKRWSGQINVKSTRAL